MSADDDATRESQAASQAADELTAEVEQSTVAVGPLAYSEPTGSLPVVEYRPPRVRPAVVAVTVVAAAAAVAGATFMLGRTTAPQTATPAPALQTPTTTAAAAAPPPVPVPSQSPVPPPPTASTVTVAVPAPAPTTTFTPISVPAFTPTATQDEQLLAALRADGWAIWDQSIVLRQAHFACMQLRWGDSVEYVNTQLAAESGMGLGPAVRLTTIAMSVYPDCHRIAG